MRKQTSLNNWFSAPTSSVVKSSGGGGGGGGNEEKRGSSLLLNEHPAVKKRRTLPPSVLPAVPPQNNNSLRPHRPSQPVQHVPPSPPSQQTYSSLSHRSSVNGSGNGSVSGSGLSGRSWSEVVDLSGEEADLTPDTPTPPPSASSSSSSSYSLSGPSYSLSLSQKKVLDLILRRENVFFTGAAGTGKSHLLKILQDLFSAMDKGEKICFTAPTGVAACNISGLTLHSWSGIGLGSDSIEQLIGQVMRNRPAVTRWLETEILVIDEISMLSGELLDKLDILGRRVRNSLSPFGGLQVVLCGDFFQLPPVGLGKQSSFAFESSVWREVFEGHPERQVVLEKVFRQKDDPTLLRLLEEMRLGQVSSQSVFILQNKVSEAKQQQQQQQQQQQVKSRGEEEEALEGSRVRPTKLFSTNKDVDRVNLEELERLALSSSSRMKSKARSDREEEEAENGRLFVAVDEGRDPYMNQLRQGTKAAQQIVLRIGAQVMLLKNLSPAEGLVNGARGTVLGFERANGRSAFYPYLPVVKFQVMIGKESREEVRVISHESWEVKQGDRVLASRIQIPLILAWALSIHKAQGMTIPFLEVSMKGIFECGQAYVALSRATSLQGLTLRDFNQQAVRAHPKVKAFYSQLLQWRRAAACAASSNEQQQEECILQVHLTALVRSFQPEKVQQVTGAGSKKGLDEKEEEEGWLEVRRPATASSKPPPLSQKLIPASRLITSRSSLNVSDDVRYRLEQSRLSALSKLQAPFDLR
eukprot:gene1245-1356_t